MQRACVSKDLSGKAGKIKENKNLSGTTATQTVDSTAPSEEDALRAQLYRLLAHCLHKPLDADGLAMAASLEGDDTDLGRAIETFAKVASKSAPDTVEQEFHDLFIGVGRGELLPYASYYLTGFLNEKPLAKLRNDMSVLGIERRASVKEPEDHIAALCEIMSGLISGAFDVQADMARQREFFTTHVGSWAKHFFTDLEAAKTSVLYGALGTVGRAFIEIEEVAFTMD